MFDSFVTPWTVVHQDPLSTGFLRQEYWSGLPFLTSGDLPDPEIEPMSPVWQVDSSTLCHLGSPYTVFTGKLKNFQHSFDNEQCLPYSLILKS